MSNIGVNLEEEEEEEHFYESLDRIKSSTCSSSCSDEEQEDYSCTSTSCSKNDVGDYDVWLSQPCSVQERRLRLLRQMGLTHHSTPGQVSLNNAMLISKSDNVTHHCNDNNDNVCTSNSSSDIVSIDLKASVINRNGVVNSKSSDGDGLLCNASGSNAVSPSKPPSGKFCRTDSACRKLSGNCGLVVVEEGEEGDVIVRVGESACTIKNLDNGKEFVVNEVRGDGSWNKVKEVGTGRQLTIEEFEMCVGHSPIVQELMRRQKNVESKDIVDMDVNVSGLRLKKKGNWLRSIKNVASSVRGQKERRSSDERDTSSEKGGRRSSSATDDSQDVSFHGPERVRVRQYGKSVKELTGLYKSQEIQAHNGSIWAMKFSLDGRYLASAGEDCVIRIWLVVESERKGDLLLDKPEDENLNLLLTNGFLEPNLGSPNFDSHAEKKRRGRTSISRKSVSFDHVIVPESVFALSEKPFCSFRGHLQDVLDLSWSKSQHLLSSSMDKTVRLWHLASRSCLKTFSHSDYVTCIQFNPVDDRYFISGSLDAKVRIWSIPDHQVVDWNDMHEMVTAASYTQDGQAAVVGSYRGNCRLYTTTENKLQHRSQINLRNKKKKPHHRKITGFQFAPGSTSEVLVTSADSRVRVVDGVDLVHKFKGFHNTNSQISASLTANGKHVVCASDDNHVFIWKHEGDSWPSRSKGVTVTQSYEYFRCQDVSAAIPWPGMCDTWGLQDMCSWEPDRLGDHLDEVPVANHPPTPVEETNGNETLPLASAFTKSPLNGTISSVTNSYFFDTISATWPEDKILLPTKNQSRRGSEDYSNEVNQRSSAWGMVIVTAGLRGDIRTYQNFGLPVQI